MSIGLVGKTYYLKLPPHLKMMLSALADEADDDGGGCYPSNFRLQWKTSTGRRTVQRSIAELRDAGWLTILGQQGGGKNVRDDRRPNLYQLSAERIYAEGESGRQEVMAAIYGASSTSPRTGDGASLVTRRGVAGDANGASSTPPDPLVDPKKKPVRERAQKTRSFPSAEQWAAAGLEDVAADLSSLNGLTPAGFPIADLYEVEYWQLKEVETEGTGVFYLEQLREYLVWWADQPKSRQHKNVRRGFSRWISVELAKERGRLRNAGKKKR